MKLINLLVFCSLLLIQSCALQTFSDSPGIHTSERIITTQGQADITHGAVLLARKLAFKNAIRNAVLATGNTLAPDILIASSKVVDEWMADDTYHIQVLSTLSKDKHCHSPYRKRIVATGFPIVTSGQISGHETQDLYAGIPREIMNLLLETGGFIGHNQTHTSLYSRPDMAPEIIHQQDYQASTVVQIAQAQNSQLVLSGVIRDFEVESTEFIRGSGIMARIKSHMRDFVARRGLAIDIYLHDGITGALLFQNRYTDTVVGDVWIPTGYTVGSERFKATPSGHKISRIIQLAGLDIRKFIDCHPLATNIIKINHKKVFIAAGTQNKLKKGDSLIVYSRNSTSDFQQHELIGVIILQNVGAAFSVGEMEVASNSRKVKTGDLVKSW